MAGITAFILRRCSPDVVRCGKFPRGQCFKVGEAVGCVKFEGVMIHGYVTNRDKFFRPIFALQRIQAYFEGQLRPFGLKIFEVMLDPYDRIDEAIESDNYINQSIDVS